MRERSRAGGPGAQSAAPRAGRNTSQGIAPARRGAFALLSRSAASPTAQSDALLRGPEVDRLSEADRHLTTTLVMGVLRWQPALDARIAVLLTQKAVLDTPVAIALRMGVYQLLFLDRVPAHAAINDSVELVKQSPQHFAAGLVNAVLRKVAAQPREQPTPESAHPEWMSERWAAHFGTEPTENLCAYNVTPPPIAVRLRGGVSAEELRAAGVEVRPGALLTRAQVLVLGDAARARGLLRVQDEGSQLLAEMAAECAGDATRILDCCAAPGGKTAILAERRSEAEAGSTIVACDISRPRLDAMRARFAREGALPGVQYVVADAASPVGAAELEAPFDLILCDAPCSGTGTLARNPEIKLRLRPEELMRQQGKQVALLRRNLNRLRPGGRLVYSTCSLEPEENEAVVEECLRPCAGVEVLPVAGVLQRLQQQGALRAGALEELAARAVRGSYLRTVPGTLPCDGFFAAVLERR